MRDTAPHGRIRGKLGTVPSLPGTSGAALHVPLTRRAFLSASLGVIAALGLAGCSTSAAAGSKTLRVGVRDDVVGFGYLNPQTNKYYGFEIDLARELARRIGYTDTSFTSVKPETRKQTLLNGDVDCLIACYTISDTRLENFDFSPAYYEDNSVMVVQNSSLIKSLDDLRGRTIGAMAGANMAPVLVQVLTQQGFTSGVSLSKSEDGYDEQFDTFRLVQLPSYDELSDALEQGSIDTMAMDGAISKKYMNDERSIIPNVDIMTQSYGVATQKDSELSQPVSKAIQDMLDDGTIAAMIDVWD